MHTTSSVKRKHDACNEVKSQKQLLQLLPLIILLRNNNTTMAKPTTLAGSTSHTIPTKRFDGGGGGTLPQSCQAFALADRESETQPLQQDNDAFARYSNDVFRMKELLLFPEESADDDLDTVSKINEAFRDVGLSGPLMNTSRNHGATPPKRRKANSTKPVAVDQHQGSVRKTRLSYEIHPNLLMHDVMREIEAVENSHYIEEEEGSSLSDIESLFRPNANVRDQASVAVTVEDDDDDEEEDN